MKLISDIFERLPQVWVLVGLLIIASGLYLGFDYSLIFVYLGVGVLCFLYGVTLFFMLLLEGSTRKKARPLSRDFIQIGEETVTTPMPQVDQEPTASH
jgi:multisubunit Na+/H+ antiporter MnhC subunit